MRVNAQNRPLLMPFICGIAVIVIAGCLFLEHFYFDRGKIVNAGGARATSGKPHVELNEDSTEGTGTKSVSPHVSRDIVKGEQVKEQQIVTEADLRTEIDLSERAARGEYILPMERPGERRMIETGIRNFAARIASNSAPELQAVLGRMGFSPEAAQELNLHQEKISWASLQVEVALQQLSQARQDYDKKIRSLLTRDQYAEYRQYEASRPAVAAYNDFKEFASSQGSQLNPDSEDESLRIIREAGAYTVISWHGPYDGIPRPAVGDEAVVASLEEQGEQLRGAEARLLESAASASIPPEQIDLFRQYYQSKITEIERAARSIQSRVASASH
jgi:hypothetical protein